MNSLQKTLLLAVLCGQIWCSFPADALAGDGELAEDEYVTEVQTDTGNEYIGGESVSAGTEDYAPMDIRTVDEYEGMDSQTEEAVKQENWENVIEGDWEQSEDTDDTERTGIEEVEFTEEQELGESKPVDDKEEYEEVSHEEISTAEYNVAEEEHLSASLAGDVNGDGTLNAIDCALLQQYIMGHETLIDKSQADFNGDGQISMLDVHGILNIVKSEGKGTGDVNGDGRVDGSDVQALTGYMAGRTVSVNRQNADLDGDGAIGEKDLEILRGVLRVKSR